MTQLFASVSTHATETRLAASCGLATRSTKSRTTVLERLSISCRLNFHHLHLSSSDAPVIIVNLACFYNM